MNQDTHEIVNIDNDEMSLSELFGKVKSLFSYLLSRWVIILFAVIIGGGVGFVYAYFKKPVYKAELTFALEDDKGAGGGIGSALGIASQFGIDLGGSGGGAFTGDNLLALMKSRSMVESTLLSPVVINEKKITLANYYISFSGLREKWKSNSDLINLNFDPGSDRSKFSIKQDSILGVIYKTIIGKNLTVDKADKKSSIVIVKVTSENELFSKVFTEILVSTVSDFYINTKTKKSAQNVNILQKQTDSVRRELNYAINGVANSIDVNPNANPSLQILRAPSQRRQVDVQANQAILTQLVANLEISKVSLRKETPLIQIIDRPILPLDKDRLGKSTGILIGGLIAGFLSSVILLIVKLLA